MRSITPPEHKHHLYLSVYQPFTWIPTQIYFFGECAKKQQFVRSLGNAQRPPEVKSALPFDPGGLIIFLIN